MSYSGDYTPGKTITGKFNTHQADGTPITLAGTPALSVYKDSTTESTSGVTLTVDYDSRTGMHQYSIDTSADGTFYAAGNNFEIVITTGTVDGVSVVGTIVGSFSLSNRSALRPTTADRTLDVTATGAAGIDWSNVENPTTAVNLSGTNIDTDQVVASVTGAVGSVTATVAANVVEANGDPVSSSLGVFEVNVSQWSGSAVNALIGGRVDANVGAVQNNAITAASIAAGAITASECPALANLDDAISTRASQASLDTVDDFLDTEIAAIKLVTEQLATTLQQDGTSAVYQFTTAALENAPTGGGGGGTDWTTDERTAIRTILGFNSSGVVGDVSSGILDTIRDTIESSFTAVNSTLTTIAGYIDTEISTLQTSVNDIPTNAELATAITTGLTTALTEGYRNSGAAGSVRDLLYEINQNITDFLISGTTKTVRKLDGTTAKTYTLNSATTPTGIQEA